MNFKSDKAIYIQIAEMIENEILNGNLKVHSQAPSTNDFSKIYQINPSTARKGLNLLVDEGVLYKKRGLGMFVSEGAKDIILEKRQREFIEILLPEVIQEAKRLEIGKEEMIEMIKQIQ